MGPFLSCTGDLRARCNIADGVSAEKRDRITTDQDMSDFLVCKCRLLAHVQFSIYHSPTVLLHRAALHPFSPQFVLILRTVLSDCVLGLVELWVFHGLIHPGCQGPSRWHIIPFGLSTAPLILVLPVNLLRVCLVSLCVVEKITNNISPTTDPWGTVCYWFPFGHWAMNCNSWDAVIQPIPYPSNMCPIQQQERCGGAYQRSQEISR